MRPLQFAGATAPERLEREEAEQRQLEQKLDALAPGWLQTAEGAQAMGALRTRLAQLEWVGNHAAEIGDPDVVELAARALEGDEFAEREALEFWRLWKGHDEPTDVP